MTSQDTRAHGVTPGLSRDYPARTAVKQAAFVQHDLFRAKPHAYITHGQTGPVAGTRKGYGISYTRRRHRTGISPWPPLQDTDTEPCIGEPCRSDGTGKTTPDNNNITVHWAFLRLKIG